MRTRIMILSFYAEMKFQRYATLLRKCGVDICAYVSFTDPVETIYQEHRPDLIVYDLHSIIIEKYTHSFTCKLLAVSDHFDLQEHWATRQLSENRATTGLNICGYIENRFEFLLAAILIIQEGQQCFYTHEEFQRYVDRN